MLLWKTVLVDLRHWNLSDVKISKLYYAISWKKVFENASAIFVNFDMVSHNLLPKPWQSLL